MTLYILQHMGNLYCYRPPTEAEIVNRFIANGYSPPDLVSERNPDVYQYARMEKPANYPVPAIRMPTFDTLYELGFASAMNGFPVEAVIKLTRFN